MPQTATNTPSARPRRIQGDPLFWISMSGFGVVYVGLIVAMVAADLRFASWQDIQEALGDERIRFSIGLSLITCTMSAILSVWVAIPSGYVLARASGEAIQRRLSGRPVLMRMAVAARHVFDTLLDVPIVLPPLVVGVSLLVLFQTPAGRWLDHCVADMLSFAGFPGIRGITYEIPAVILGQFTVAAAFAVRTMRGTFEHIDPRPEQVALTLGARNTGAFIHVVLPQAWRGTVAAFTLAWARSLGEFGPILIFAGTARMKTEVLSSTVYLNFSIGNLRGAVAASLIMLTLAGVVLLLTRLLALGGVSKKGGLW